MCPEHTGKSLREDHPHQGGKDLVGHRDVLGVRAASSAEVASDHHDGDPIEADCPEIEDVKALKPTQTVLQ